MAKKKPKPEETPEPVEEAVEPVEAAEPAPAGDEVDIDAIAPDEEAAEAAPPADADEEVAEEEAPPPRPRVTGLTLALCVLMLLAAGGTFAVVALDHGRRSAWSYQVFLNDLALMGLPLAEEGQSGGV